MKTSVRSALITAAAQGMGLETARLLASRGVNLSLVDRQSDTLEKAAEELSAKGVEVIYQVADVTEPESTVRVVQQTMEKFGRIDMLANIAGGAGPRNLHQIEEFTREDWDFVLKLNLTSAFDYCHAVVPIMRSQGYGRIVNMSSTLANGRFGPVGTAGARLAYAAAKAGIIGFTAQLAKDVGAFGITVNAVRPWLTFSEAPARVKLRYEAMSEEERKKWMDRSPLGRPGNAHEVAAAIGFFLSEEASFTNGASLLVDGAYL